MTPRALLDRLPPADRRELDRLAAELADGAVCADPEAYQAAQRELAEWVDLHGLARWVADAVRVLEACDGGGS